MHDHQSTSAVTTLGIGALATMISQMNMNDWLVFLSILLVVLRISFETYDFILRRSDRRNRRQRETDGKKSKVGG